MMIATAPWISSAAHGVAQRGWMLPRKEKIRPSRAIAYGTRVLASRLPLSAPNTLVMIASMMTAPPAGPATALGTDRPNPYLCCARLLTGAMYKEGRVLLQWSVTASTTSAPGMRLTLGALAPSYPACQ